MRRAAILLAALLATLASASVTAWAYFNETKTNQQTVSMAEAAPQVRLESTSSVHSAPGNVTIGKPSGVRSGWLLIATIHVDGTSSIEPPSGWNLIRNTDSPLGSVRLNSYWRKAGAFEPPYYTFVLFPGNASTAGILAYSGVTAFNPIAASAEASGKSASATAPTANTSQDGRRIVAAVFNRDSPLTFTGATVAWQRESLYTAGGTADAPQFAGTTDPTTVGGADVGWAVQTIVINGG